MPACTRSTSGAWNGRSEGPHDGQSAAESLARKRRGQCQPAAGERVDVRFQARRLPSRHTTRDDSERDGRSECGRKRPGRTASALSGGSGGVGRRHVLGVLGIVQKQIPECGRRGCPHAHRACRKNPSAPHVLSGEARPLRLHLRSHGRRRHRAGRARDFVCRAGERPAVRSGKHRLPVCRRLAHDACACRMSPACRPVHGSVPFDLRGTEQAQPRRAPADERGDAGVPRKHAGAARSQPDEWLPRQDSPCVQKTGARAGPIRAAGRSGDLVR